MIDQEEHNGSRWVMIRMGIDKDGFLSIKIGHYQSGWVIICMDHDQSGWVMIDRMGYD